MNEVAEKIAAEITREGAISFARFMDLALYCPEYGYYEKEEDTIGRRGDFYTSVSVGGLFGELLAFQFAQWLAEPAAPKNQAALSISGDDERRQIVEAGAHDGRLAGDILGWLRQHRPLLYERLEYLIVEPSARRRDRQATSLSPYKHKVRWITELNALAVGQETSTPHPPGSPLHVSRFTSHVPPCIIFANELLDAFPVHRLAWDAPRRQWFEWGVRLQGGRLAWTRMPDRPDSPPLPQSFDLPSDLLAVLPDGFVLEVCPAAETWWRQAARLLDRGKLLTLDYGADEALAPERCAGTLRAYYRHRRIDDVLDRPGEQDLTAHVNFPSLIDAGEAEGLRTESFTSQERFLTRIAAQLWATPADTGEWPPQYKRQFHTLTHPQLLGRTFRVLVQSRATTAAAPSAAP